MKQDAIITVDAFGMQFGHTEVITGLTFHVERGEIFGFLGANGSGKTTTIRALLGLLEPTRGKLCIDGRPFTTDNTAKIGYLPEERGLYRKESVLDVLVYFAVLKGVARKDAKKRAAAYLERVGLADKSREQIGRLSGGQQQKIQLGVTILHEPQLLILDEPTKGLDPVNRTLLLNIINELHDKGSTIFLVSHDMEDVEKLCDHIVLLKDGKREFFGTVEAIKQEYGTEMLAMSYDGALPANPKLYTIHKALSHYAELARQRDVSSSDVLKQLIATQGLDVKSFARQQTSLDDIFLQIYGKSKA